MSLNSHLQIEANNQERGPFSIRRVPYRVHAGCRRASTRRMGSQVGRCSSTRPCSDCMPNPVSPSLVYTYVYARTCPRTLCLGTETPMVTQISQSEAPSLRGECYLLGMGRPRCSHPHLFWHWFPNMRSEPPSCGTGDQDNNCAMVVLVLSGHIRAQSTS